MAYSNARQKAQNKPNETWRNLLSWAFYKNLGFFRTKGFWVMENESGYLKIIY